jgi:hypothetical protein
VLRTHLVESFLIHAPDLQGALELFAVEPAGLVTEEESTHGQDIGVSMHTREGRVGGGGASLPVDDAKGAAESGHAVRAARLHVLLQLRQAAFEGPYTRHDDRGYERELCVCGLGWGWLVRGCGKCFVGKPWAFVVSCWFAPRVDVEIEVAGGQGAAVQGQLDLVRLSVV